MKVFVKILGCAKNLVEAETIAGNLVTAGHMITGDINSADVAIVHTCAFMEDAQKESLAAIKSILRRRRLSSHNQKVIVSGCLAQYLSSKAVTSQIKQIVNKADFVVGTGNLAKIPQIVSGKIFEKRKIIEKPGGLLKTKNRVLPAQRPWAYIRVAEGCNHRCNYCLIPVLRGSYKSRKKQEIIDEARRLADCGVKEINLISQDTASYGLDLYKHTDLTGLLSGLEKIDGIKWIRLLYCHPNSVRDELIDYIKSSSKVVPYIDIPLQHISDAVLERMGRKITSSEIRKLIEKLVTKIPDIAMRTTFIIGHPGESEKDFQKLCDFIKEEHFLWIGLFKYSKQKGTVSGESKNQISAQEKARRFKAIKKIADSVMRKKYRSMIFNSSEVLVETPTTGRTYLSAPEDDGIIQFDAPVGGDVKIGDFVKLKLNREKTQAIGYSPQLIADRPFYAG